MARGKEGEGGVKVWGELNTSLSVWDLQLMVGDSFSENQFSKLLSPISPSIKKKKKEIQCTLDGQDYVSNWDSRFAGVKTLSQNNREH